MRPGSSWETAFTTLPAPGVKGMAPRFLGQIHLTYADGTEEVIASGPDWKASKSPILLDNVYDGEHYDARLEQPGW